MAVARTVYESEDLNMLGFYIALDLSILYYSIDNHDFHIEEGFLFWLFH